MTTIYRVGPLLALVLAFAACGGGDQSAEIAASLPQTATNDGDTLTDVSCIKREGGIYRCVGQYETSEANAIAAYVEQNGLTEEEAAQMDDSLRRMIAAQASGQVKYEVTMSRDGKYMFERI